MPPAETREPGHDAGTGSGAPIVLTDTTAVANLGEVDAAGAVWRLQQPTRDLDSNIIALPPEGRIEAHDEPAIDVLIHVLAGSGRLTSPAATLDLRPGVLAWLPRGSPRQFTAGGQGLRYLTVHRRKPGLSLSERAR